MVLKFNNYIFSNLIYVEMLFIQKCAQICNIILSVEVFLFLFLFFIMIEQNPIYKILI